MADTCTASFDWLDLVRTLAAVSTPVIGLVALQNWRRQDKAKREVEFLDALLDAAHLYIEEMSKPVTLLNLVKLSMGAFTREWESGSSEDKATKGAIAYIQHTGAADGKQLLGTLEPAKLSKSKVMALSVKGQVFRFADYRKCQDAVTTLTWHYGRVEALAVLITQTSLDFENPEVLRVLKKVMEIDAAQTQTSMAESNVALLEFARETYEKIYGDKPLLKRSKNAK